jgi:hypothetical protein
VSENLSAQVATRPSNAFGTTALVLGLIGLVGSILLVGGLLGLAAVVLGILALGRIRRGEATNRPVAIAGVALGVLSLVIPLVLLVGRVSFYSSHEGQIERLQTCMQQAKTDRQREDCQQRFHEGTEHDRGQR